MIRRIAVGPLAAVAFAVLAGCGDGRESASGSQFAPLEVGRHTLRLTAEAGPDDLRNHFLTPGRTFEVIQLDVPDLPCVRTDTDDYLHVPEVTTVPGGAAVLYVVPPADSSQPVMIFFHGNGLEFIEASASLFAHARPELAAALLQSDPNIAGYIEIDNRGGALRSIQGEIASSQVAEALERGWGVVIPGNCWGDGGYGEGEVAGSYISAPRYGHVMDRGAWDWFRETYPHDSAREYSFGCSGGGQRTAQFLLNDPNATAASGIDSPADYLPGFRDDPPALFALLEDIPEFPAVLEAFYVDHYGSVAAAGEESLGAQLAARRIQTPIYLTYSDEDTFATPGVTGTLVQALSEREPRDRAFVWNTGEPVHCQVNTRERAKAALDWLARWRRSDS